MSSVDANIDMPLHEIKACARSTLEAPSSIPQLVIELTIEYIREIQVSFIDETTRLGSSEIEPFKWRSVLSRLCLVQKSWRIPAQRNLQKRVVMQTNDQIYSAITQPSLFKFSTHDLWITYPFKAPPKPQSSGTIPKAELPRHILISQLLSRFSNLQYISIQIGNFIEDRNPELLHMLHKIMFMTQLKGLSLTHSRPKTDRSGRMNCKYQCFTTICEVVSKLRHLKFLHIGNFCCRETEIDADLSYELCSCTPPKTLKTIILETSDAPHPRNYVRWLLAPREGYAVENLLIRINGSHHEHALHRRNGLIADKFMSIRRLTLENERRNKDLAHDAQNIILNCPSAQQVHLNSILPKGWLELPAHIEELSFRFDSAHWNHKDYKRKDDDLLALLVMHIRKRGNSKLCRIIVKVSPHQRFGPNSLFPQVFELCVQENIRLKFKESRTDEMESEAEFMKLAVGSGSVGE